MSYTALYRKFRPQNFNEIVGQDHITKTLKNQIIANRVGHAYLLNGGRGTGKTSAAKILARAVNCLNPKDGEPCNECEICKAALQGSLTDIVEMDAASNNSVEDVRSIRDEVNFLPTLAKYRVYIIDEVHMLSTGAFNALLKTLEEPPEHVKFILATTEPQKLPATILSRCQRFDFRKISTDDIIKRLKEVTEKENINITPEAMKTIAILADGAMRDAWSILERCLQEGSDVVDDELVKNLAGIPKTQYIYKIVSAITKYDATNVLEEIDVVVNEGKDLTNLLWEIIKYVKDVLVYKTSGRADLYNEKEIGQIKELADASSKQRLLNIIYSLSELENNIKWSSQKTIMFQVGMMKLCNNESAIQNYNIQNGNPQIPAQVINKPVQKVDNSGQNQPKNANPGINTNVDSKIKFEQPVPQKPANNVSHVTGGNVNCWGKVIGTLKESGKIMLYTNLMPGKAVELNDMTIGIEFANGLTSFGKTILEKPENITEISKLVSVEYGKPMQIKIIDGSAKKQSANINPMDSFTQDLGMPINIIDD